MPTAHLYFPDDLYPQYQSLSQGEASKIFQNALREHFGTIEDVNQVKKKLNLLYEENNTVTNKISFLEKRKEELEIKQGQEEERLKALEQQTIQKEQSKRINFYEVYRDYFNQEPSENFYEMYRNGSWRRITDFLKYLETRGLAIRVELNAA